MAGTDRRAVRPSTKKSRLLLSCAWHSGAAGPQFFTSNRRTADQGPEPPALFARARHHILTIGNVLVLN